MISQLVHFFQHGPIDRNRATPENWQLLNDLKLKLETVAEQAYRALRQVLSQNDIVNIDVLTMDILANYPNFNNLPDPAAARIGIVCLENQLRRLLHLFNDIISHNTVRARLTTLRALEENLLDQLIFEVRESVYKMLRNELFNCFGRDRRSILMYINVPLLTRLTDEHRDAQQSNRDTIASGLTAFERSGRGASTPFYRVILTMLTVECLLIVISEAKKLRDDPSNMMNHLYFLSGFALVGFYFAYAQLTRLWTDKQFGMSNQERYERQETIRIIFEEANHELDQIIDALQRDDVVENLLENNQHHDLNM